MTDRLDILRSLVRAAADRAVDRFSGTRLASATKQILERLTQQRWRLSDEALTTAAAHAEGVDSAMVVCQAGKMFVDASMTSGKEVQFSLSPRSVRFAPRGAKEISFDVEPPEAHDPSIVGALSKTLLQGRFIRDIDAFELVSRQRKHIFGFLDHLVQGRVGRPEHAAAKELDPLDRGLVEALAEPVEVGALRSP